MIWGVGTGRCGTKSLAADLNGHHEPEPWLGEDAILAHHGGAQARDRTILRLAERFKKGVPCVDMHHSWLIPLIKQIDPEPFFVWQIRNPRACVRSLLVGGSWTERDWHGAQKWYPEGGWEDGVTRFDKALRYWVEVNTLIQHNAPGASISTPEMLRNHLNQYPRREFEFTEDQERRLSPAVEYYHRITAHWTPATPSA